MTTRVVLLQLLACAALLTAADEAAGTRNAIFNGAFSEGVTGFSVLGPGCKSAALSVATSQHAQTLTAELLVACPGMERTFTVYSPYLLHVQPGRGYPMALRAAGTGHIALGAFEYDENGAHIGNATSERFVLTPEFQQLSFTYTPSRNATGMRPAIVFLEATDGTRLDVRARFRSFEMPVPVAEFGTLCASWPEYAKDAAFAAYPGFSEAELAELRQLVAVDDVLPPYRPLAMESPGVFTLTTSRLELDPAALPRRITVLGQDILAGPLDLVIEYADGRRADLEPGLAALQVSAARAVVRPPPGAGKAIRVSLELHYDAFLVYTIDIPADPGAVIASASLAIPFLPGVARYISYDRSALPEASGAGGWVFGYGPIPGPGERVETKATVGSAQMGEAVSNDWKPAVPGADGVIWEWQRGVLQMLWIGDESRGLSLAVPSTAGYALREHEPSVRLVRHEREVTLTYRFITATLPLDSPRQFQFVLQIMPPKPVRKDWSAGRYNVFFPGYQEIVDKGLAVLAAQLQPPGAGGGVQAEAPRYATVYDVLRTGVSPRPWERQGQRPYRDIGFLWYSLWSKGGRGAGLPVGGCSTPLVGSPERLASLVRISDLLGHRGLPYFAATHIAAEDPAGYFYVERQDEWTQHPRVPRPPYLRPTCPNSLFSAYLARGIGRLIDEYGITGVYFDNCAPQLCQNTRHGCGYRDEHGDLQPTVPFLGFRQLFMMVRREFTKRGKEPLILTHSGLFPGAVSFTDVELQGEGTYGSDHTEMFTLGEWRARWLGPHQFGVQLTYLPAFGYGLGPNTNMVEQETLGTPRLLAMSLLHGTQVWNEYVDTPLLFRAWTVLDEVDAAEVTFVPYWQWPSANQPLNALGVYATAYGARDRLVLVLANLSASEHEVALPFAELTAQNPLLTRVADTMHGLPVSLADGVVRCTVGARNFRLLSFSK